MHRIFFAHSLIGVCLLGLLSCSGARYFRKSLRSEIEHSPVFTRAFTGFHLVDAATGRTLCAVNADRYFTPASNTKILTLATCLRVLGDSIPGARTWRGTETEFAGIWPTGDPTFLHPQFQAWQTLYHHIRVHPSDSVFLFLRDGVIQPLGPGWAWDDAEYDYSAERSAFPIYGNVRRIYAQDLNTLTVEPPFWNSKLQPLPLPVPQGNPLQSGDDNLVYYNTADTFPAGFEEWVPVHGAAQYIRSLLEDTLKKTVVVPNLGLTDVRAPDAIIYSCPSDTVLRRMMYQSDNFIAEQLLLVCEQAVRGTSMENLLKWVPDSLVKAAAQKPKWVDGSGLSRYNLFTPNYLTALLRQLYLEQPRERLFSLFPAGGASGTIANWYAGPDGRPFVFAKTGSMSGVHCLSGYLLTAKGRVLIFSFMHNNFTGSNKPWKEEMQRLLLEIRAKG